MKNIRIYATLLSILGILLNALANAFVAKAFLGNTPIGITAMNMSSSFNMTFGTAITILCVISFVLARIISRSYRPIADTIGLIISIVFGVIIDMFTVMLEVLPMTNALYQWIYCMFGLLVMTLSIALYIKADVIILAFDDLMNKVRIHLTGGNFTKASNIVFTIFIIFAIAFGLLGEHSIGMYGIVGINFASIIIFFAFGPLIGLYTKILEKPLNKFLALDEK